MIYEEPYNLPNDIPKIKDRCKRFMTTVLSLQDIDVDDGVFTYNVVPYSSEAHGRHGFEGRVITKWRIPGHPPPLYIAP